MPSPYSLPRVPAPSAPGTELLHIVRNDVGWPVRVLVGTLDITHLVARVGTNTTQHGTTVEVVLTERVFPPAPGLAQ